MTRNVLEWLEQAAAQCPNAPALEDVHGVLTYGALRARAREIGSHVAAVAPAQSPVLILMEKTPMAVAAMLGAAYAGCFYTPADAAMPAARLGLVAGQLKPACVICDEACAAQAEALGLPVHAAEAIPARVDEAALRERWNNHIDEDLLYVLFTSGSTGVPKGVAVRHRSVIDFICWADNALGVEPGSRFGNQAPLYFDNSVLDIYLSLRTLSCVFFLPKVDFGFPARLLADMRAHGIDTLFWVPSALTAVAASGLLGREALGVKRVYFCGEVMPVRTLNAWRAALPDARFINMYGPTEITDVCTWYEVDREFADGEALPIGRACANARVFLIDGEICVTGTCLAAGYYNAPERTAEAFVQNPLCTGVAQRMYRTGDLGAYNDRGELMFLGRRDSQIKRNGYRIELGEIECALMALEGVEAGLCLYEAGSIACVYAGGLEQKRVKAGLKAALPRYMLPDRYVKLEEMPRTANGKVDRVAVRRVIEHEHPLP